MSENNFLTKEQVIETFVNTPLEDNYNFIEADLVKLANAFVAKAKVKIELQAINQCLEIANDLNKEVGAIIDRKIVVPRLHVAK